MIRDAQPGDERDIHRLCLAQFVRTPWPLDDPEVCSRMHVCLRRGRIAGVLTYRFLEHPSAIHVINVWVEDGISGRRAAWELCWDMVELARVEESELLFTVAEHNRGLQKAVEKFGCAPEFGLIPGAVLYRRRAKERTT
jgi:hypothetical protein